MRRWPVGKIIRDKGTKSNEGEANQKMEVKMSSKVVKKVTVPAKPKVVVSIQKPKVEEKPDPKALLAKARDTKAETLKDERNKVFMKLKDTIAAKYDKKMTLAQIQKDIEPELKKIGSTMAPVFAVYYTLNRMGLKKTKLEQKILENESRQ